MGRVWGLFLHHASHEGTSSQNSVLLRDLHCRGCERYLYYANANAAILLHFVLKTHTFPFAIQVEPPIFWSCLHLAQSSSSFFFSIRHLGVPFQCRIEPVALKQWYSTWGTRTSGGTRRHLRGYVKLKKKDKYIIS